MQVTAALQQAMQEAAKRDESIHKGINFEAFLTMLRSDPQDSLDMVLSDLYSRPSQHMVQLFSPR